MHGKLCVVLLAVFALMPSSVGAQLDLGVACELAPSSPASGQYNHRELCLPDLEVVPVDKHDVDSKA